jgi:uncharacterized protein (TIGR00369 family)
MTPVMTISEMQVFLEEVFPQISGEFTIEQMDGRFTRMRLNVGERHLRPGGTVSGPAMFGLADVTAYVATMAPVGREALAVTTNCSLDFMRKPEAGVDIIATGELLKLGRSLAVVDVRLCSEGQEDLVARATMTYSIPPRRKA